MRKNLIRLTALCLLIMILFASCTPSADNPSDSEGEETTTVPAETEGPVYTPEDGKVAVTGYRQPLMNIVYPASASANVKKAAQTLRTKMYQRVKAKPEIITDKVKEGEQVDDSLPEILIGHTNRQASSDLIAALPANSYGIRVTENKVVIAGTDDTMLAYALYDFTNKFLVDKQYFADSQHFVLPIGTELIVSDDTLTTHDSKMTTVYRVNATVDNWHSASPSKGCSTGQGIATDGTYFYTVLTKGDDTTGVIVKQSMETWKTVAVSEPLELNHGNDMCYNSDENVLVVVNMKGKKLTKVDPETLTVKQVVVLPYTNEVTAVAYNANYDKYVFNMSGKVIITDTQFNVLQSIGRHYPTGSTGQGIDCDDDYIYAPVSCDGYNIIIVYSWTRYIKEIKLDNNRESESMANYNGKYYISFNSDGSRVAEIHYDVVF